MIKGISYWSMEGGLDGSCPVEKALAECRRTGFAALELCVAESGVLTPGTDEATCRGYRVAADRVGVRLDTVASGMSWGCSPTHPDPAVRTRAIRLHQDALRRAAWVGATSMLFVPGAVRIPWDDSYGPVRYDHAVAWAAEAVDQLATTAQAVGVELCVENVWNGMFYSPLELAAFVDRSAGRGVGVYFDAGNVLGYHQDPAHWVELLGRRIKRVHVKDFKRSVGNIDGFCDLLEGDLPWARTQDALKAICYDRTVVAEMIPFKPGQLERTSAAMDRMLAM